MGAMMRTNFQIGSPQFWSDMWI